MVVFDRAAKELQVVDGKLGDEHESASAEPCAAVLDYARCIQAFLPQLTIKFTGHLHLFCTLLAPFKITIPARLKPCATCLY